MSGLETYLERWGLVTDAPPFVTPSSAIAYVRTADGRPAVLKLALVDEEQRGNALMAAWDGSASAAVLAHDGAAVLLERATGPRSLEALAAADDDAATRVLVRTARALHAAPPVAAGVAPVPLRRWFRDLLEASDPALDEARTTAARLLDDPLDEVVLHGDVHHGNVLDFGDATRPVWKAIDPKGLVGESGFDYANILCNPDATRAVNHEPGRLARRIVVVAETSGLPAERIRDWHTAWHALSAIWSASGS